MSKVLTSLDIPENGLTVLEKRYLRRDESGNVLETPEEMFERIAKTLASVENKYPTSRSAESVEEDFYDILSSLKFVSGTPMRNAGRSNRILSACFVLPIEDHLTSIYGTLHNAALVHRAGAAVGYDFSKIRPEGDMILSTGKPATGPISFMRLFDFSSEVILNIGSIRHAGHMGVLRVDHPDIFKFIDAKKDYSQLTNFNISVAITDAFMDAVKTDSDFNLINPRDGKVWETVSARKLLRQIAESAHSSAEPGVIFIDEINRHNTVPGVGKIESVNQCGEQPLLPYEACTLGSIVLPRFLNETQEGYVFDWNEYERVVRLAVRFLDNSIDLNEYPIQEMYDVNHGNRRIGLGVMGFADVLAYQGIPYDSEDALELARKLMKRMTDIGRDESMKLAEEKGSFPNFDKSVFEKWGFDRMRNCTITTIAPTGTTSLVAGVSGGIEPFFALAYTRQNMETMGDTKLVELNPVFKKVSQKRGVYSNEIMERIGVVGSVRDIDAIPDDLKRSFVTAHDISPEWHVKMQAAFQEFTDNAITKTVNMPEQSTIEDVENVYIQAYDLKCKGVTVYRNNSRDTQVLTVGAK